MNKFRTRRYIRQLLKERPFMTLDCTKLTPSQTRVALQLMSNILLAARQRKQGITIKTH